MGKTIDQKVVEMQFDNRQFEKNVSTTLTSVEKLKQSLNFTGASKGLEDVGNATKKIDMVGLGSAVDAVKMRFSALEVMGVTALANITNSAVNAGKRIVSALTIDPIKTGFQEYETQINAVQTILANTQSKGSTLSDVNKALSELNEYADQTIYNFTEMTRNIGTFTAAGVDLDKSVTSIKGIANLAAVSGSNAQQASTAMYQLSQALAAGRVSLMDWNSVVNAGMGGEVFQTALKRTATQMGTDVDALIEHYGSFRESLTKGQWLTAEVLTETLTQLSGAYTEADLIAQGYTEKQAKDIVDLANTAVSAATDVKTFTQLWDTLKESAQSGWTQTWEILVGDFEEAKSLLSELSQVFGDIIGKSADARNSLLYDSMTSNWKKITDGITEAGLSAEDFKSKVTEIAKSKGMDIDEIIADYGSLEAAFKNGALSSDLLNEALIKMTGSSDEIAKKLTKLRGEYKTNDDILKALNKAGYENADIQDLIAKNTNGQTIALNDLSDAQLMSIGYTADQVKSIRELSEYAELAGGSLQEFIDNVAVPQGRELLVDTLRVSLRSLIAIFERVGAAWREVFPPMTSSELLNIIKSIQEFTLSLRPSEETLDKLQRTFRGLFSILSIVKQGISALLSPIGTLIGNFASMSGGILDVTASFGDWLYALDQSIKVNDSFATIREGLTAFVNFVTDTIQASVDKIGGIGGALSGIGDVVSKIFDGIKTTIGEAFDWIRKNISTGDIFAGLAGGGLFVLAKKLTGFVDTVKEAFEGLFERFGGDGEGTKFSDILGSVHDSLESFQQGIQVASLVGIATAVTLLSSSLKKISEIEPVKVAYSLVAIRLMILSLTSGFKSLSKTLTRFNSKGTIRASITLIGIATAVNILTSAMEKLAGLSWGDIVKGLVGVSGSILALSTSLKLIGKSNVTLRTSIAIVVLAQACKTLSEALKSFGEMSWGEIARGLTAMAGALIEFTAVLTILSKVGGGGAILGGTAILIAAQSLDEISENLKRLGDMSWGDIGRGLTAMAGALIEFTAVLTILSKVGGGGAILGAAAILLAAQSLDEISENLKRLGDLAWDEIGRGLTAMGGALTELSVISGLLGKLAGASGLIGAATILIAVQGLGDLADALQEFGSMAWDEIGRGLVAMGGALTELGVISGLLGKLAGFSGLVGAGTILLAVQGLGDLADAMQKFGSMTWDEIGRGLAAMGGALLELSAITGATGMITGIAGLVGAGTILLAVQGLGDLADALVKFGSMSWDEIGRGLSAMGGALGEVALGGLLNTLSGFGAAAIAEIAKPLGDLADSVRKWEGVTIPEGLGTQLGSLATGVSSFNFAGWGADAIAAMAAPIGTMADSIKKWQGVIIPDTLGDQLASLATGVSAFNFAGWGADAIAATAPAIGQMADSIKKWQSISIAEEVGTGLEKLAQGVEAFSFAFMGGWSISAIVEPLASLADTVSKWSGVTIPADIHTGLQNLADGVGAFNFSFLGGWSIDGIVEPLANLADSVKKWNNVSLSNAGSDLTGLANGLKTLGEVGVRGIMNEFEGAADSVVSSVTRILDGVTNTANSKKSAIVSAFGQIMESSISEISGKYGKIVDVAGTLVTRFANTVKTKSSLVVNAFETMMSEAVSNISGRQSEMTSTAETLVVWFSNAVRSKSPIVASSFNGMISDAISNIRSYYNAFHSAGVYLVDGFAKGISDRTWAAEAKAKAMAKAAERAAEKTLDINSPSKVGYRIGGFFGLGFVNALGDYVDKSYDSSSKMAESAKEGLTKAVSTISSVIEDGIDSQPTIRPVLDLSNIESGASRLNTLFSANQAMAINTSMNRELSEENQNGTATKRTGSVFNFTQNNYSPKALSRVEIYRQTKNQFSAMERMVET